MVLTLDVGNTNIVMSVYRDDTMLFSSRISTVSTKMEDEYAIDFLNLLMLNGCNDQNFQGAIISTVVPQLKSTLKRAVERIFKCKVMVVSTELKTGLNICLNNPKSLGSDRICDAVAVKNLYSLPAVICDLGTATTISAIDKDSNFLGGSIFPGVNTSLKTLSNVTAQLPHIDLRESCTEVIGRDTASAMHSGVVFGMASLMDGMAMRYREILGEDAILVATGGLSDLIVPHCREKFITNKNLVSDGLYMLYKMNCDMNFT
jgi:type III pantothenate kinase